MITKVVSGMVLIGLLFFSACGKQA
ncbi:uncharacterized protein METZ01_LOCUS305858, partial [marine metagenome]